MGVYSYCRTLLNEASYKAPSIPYTIDRFVTVTSNDGMDNVCLYLKGSDTLFRARSELLIFKDDLIFLDFKSRPNEYRVPGGGWDDIDRSHAESAIREAQEEARINVKDVTYYGLDVHSEQPHGWVKKKIPKDQWWYGYYTEVYIGYYDGEHKGKVEEIDKDSMYKNGDWYRVSEIYDKLKPIHREAVSSLNP